jgi:curved DNA-binding protein CbpA
VKRFLEQTFYELLEVSRSATPEEISRAWERARALYGPASIAAYTLLRPDEAARLGARIDEARAVLLDPEARAAYDARLPSDEARVLRTSEVAPQASPPPAAPKAPFAVPSAFVPPEGAAWTGDLLRQAREARGLSIGQMADRIKVSRVHIEAVESERFDQLPVAVYLRGIVMCIARELRLDGQKVARSYLERASSPRAGR